MQSLPENRVLVICPHCETKIAVDKRKLESHGRCLRCQKLFLLTQFPGRHREPAIPLPTRDFATPPRPSRDATADRPHPLVKWWLQYWLVIVPVLALTSFLVLLYVWPTLAIIYLFVGISFLSSRYTRQRLIGLLIKRITR